MKKLFHEEIYEVLKSKSGACTYEEIAQAINATRIRNGENSVNYSLVPWVIQEIASIRRNPEKYGFNIAYKSTSNREPFVILSSIEDPFLDKDIRRTSVEKGRSRVINIIIVMLQRARRHIEAQILMESNASKIASIEELSTILQFFEIQLTRWIKDNAA